MTDNLTLHEAADELGVHYMTAYRYVRTGMLDANKSGGVWQVTREAVDRFRAGGERGPVEAGRRAPWSERLEARLLAGDARGAWGVVEAAMTAGAELDEVYLDVLTPAMVSIGDRWAAGEIDVAIEHRASGIAMRLLGRLGPRFNRRGRTRGSVIVGAPEGEFHSLPSAILGDLLRLEGWDVSDLGADVPSDSYVYALGAAPEVFAVGLSVTAEENFESLRTACTAIRDAAPDVLIVVGGRIIHNEDQALTLGADAYAPDAPAMSELLQARLGETATGT
ncbi:MAG: B12-binding domain-containing protein [Ilumatobacteraceae bacterium]